VWCAPELSVTVGSSAAGMGSVFSTSGVSVLGLSCAVSPPPWLIAMAGPWLVSSVRMPAPGSSSVSRPSVVPGIPPVAGRSIRRVRAWKAQARPVSSYSQRPPTRTLVSASSVAAPTEAPTSTGHGWRTVSTTAIAATCQQITCSGLSRST
jgi:hypothetical protein